MASRKNTEDVTIMTGKTKHIVAFLVANLLWKRKKEGKATASQMQSILVTHVCKKTAFIYMTLHSSVPNRKNFYTLKNNQLPLFITRSANTHNL